MSTSHITNPEERISAMLAAICFILPYFTNKKTEFVVFFMKQNFMLTVAIIILKCFSFLPFIGWVFGVVNFAVLLVIIFLAYRAYFGIKTEIPLLLEPANKIISNVDFLQKFFSPKN